MQSDITAVFKAQLRLTSQRLGQVQAKNDSQAKITRTDVATLIQRDNIPLAREKAEKLILDEAFGDLLEEAEMQIGVLQEHFHELERNAAPSPVIIEASSTIIYAAPYVHSQDLDVIRKSLIQRLGPDFTRSASGNHDLHVSPRVLRAISTAIPSAFQLDAYMQEIAHSYGVSWTPGPSPLNIINSLSEFLDLQTDAEVDLPRLRKLCLRGIPHDPVWLRPRIWKLFFGVLPRKKVSWKAALTQQRDAYYDLVPRLLEPFTHSELDRLPVDDTLLSVNRQLSGLPRHLFFLLEDEPGTSSNCPLHEDAPENLKISSALVLESRLKILESQAKETSHSSPTPEIRLEPNFNTTPGISLTSFDSGFLEDSNPSTTLLPSRKCIFGNAHPQHCSSLLRILYLHNAINPGSPSYHTASLLVPLYSVLTQEVDVDELAHVEADTFWLLEAVLAEISGLEDDDGKVWMKALSERLSWTDFDLFADLESRGLDPALPHYSYRWLMPMLTHTLPLHSLFSTWDALFSRPPREKGSYPKLDYLIDICVSMLLRAKSHLLRISNIDQNTRSLWTTERSYRLPPSQTHGQSQDAFMDALYFLQAYKPKYVGGIERVLQTASELAQRREQESITAQPTMSLGTRFKMWRSFALPAEVPTEPSKRQDHTNDETGPPYQSNLAFQITDTLWKGFTNQTAMEDSPPTPSPRSPSLSLSQEPSVYSITSKVDGTQSGPTSPSLQGSFGIWGYAEKLKDSDTVATLSKVSSNWRAKGLLGSWGISSLDRSNSSSQSIRNDKEDASQVHSNPTERRGSLPFADSPRVFSPPARLSPSEDSFQNPPGFSPPINGSLIGKTKSLIAMARSPPPTSKSAPKPLLLNSSTLITSGRRHPRSENAGSTPTLDPDEWADVMRTKRQHFHRDSQSSVSSLSPSDAFGRTPKSTRSDWESDPNPSRIIALNRRSVSPMAPTFRVGHARPSSRNSSVSSGLHSPPTLAKSPLQESNLINSQPISFPSDILGATPVKASVNTALQTGSYSEQETDSSDTTSNELPPPSRRPSRKKLGALHESEDTAYSVAIGLPARAPRVRSKRHPRPANLQIQDGQRLRISAEQKTSSPSNLTVEWPGDELENITTPKATSFDSDESPGLPKSPRRSRKPSSGDLERPNEEQPRKVSGGHRTRKISAESREVPRNRRESEAEEGDDEGYDELLSAYESEDGPRALR
ncbi:hypothetical protein GALMADRAFT_221365 [Galerina marginata CBS 339.88]|uniref:Rab-GAP TBC domain-containing protein n=1 Tax=Galerina marginata (strain CBS 339.88) TaxID=685588 RepID=A0A067TGP9_GALM3|nr:hypothetical protein GALMADRAFT_221365 [Galerina marginata CBS 339.88]